MDGADRCRRRLRARRRKKVFSFWQATDEARNRTRREPGDPADDDSRPVNVREALDRYQTRPRQNGGNPYNASRARLHLTPTWASRPVATLGRRELLRWRDSLLAKGLAPATVNRMRSTLRAALELAAAQDARIKNTLEFKMGLPGLKGCRPGQLARLLSPISSTIQSRRN